MSDYYLKVGGTEVLSEQLIADLASQDDEVRRKANALLAERLKETRVRIELLRVS